MSWPTLFCLALSLLAARRTLIAAVSMVALLTENKARRRTALAILRLLTSRPSDPSS